MGEVGETSVCWGCGESPDTIASTICQGGLAHSFARPDADLIGFEVRVRVEDVDHVCRDCGEVIRRVPVKALSGEVAIVWSTVEDWICPATGDEHESERSA